LLRWQRIALDRLAVFIERFDMHDLVGSPVIVAQPLNSAACTEAIARTVRRRIMSAVTGLEDAQWNQTDRTIKCRHDASHALGALKRMIGPILTPAGLTTWRS